MYIETGAYFTSAITVASMHSIYVLKIYDELY